MQQSIPTFLPPCLNPSFATLFSTSSRTTVATPLQKAAPLVRSNRLKPCCNLGLNGVSTLGSNRVAPSFQTLLQTKKHRDFTLGVCNLGFGTVVHTRWNGRCKITGNYSHSIVPGGLCVTSYHKDPAPASLSESQSFSRRLKSISAKFAVMASELFTGRITMQGF